MGAFELGEIVTSYFPLLALALLRSSFSRLDRVYVLEFNRYFPEELIETSSRFFVEGTLDGEVPGIFKNKEFGATKEDVNMKNMSNKNIISVNEDILNSALTLFLFLIPIMN